MGEIANFNVKDIIAIFILMNTASTFHPNTCHFRVPTLFMHFFRPFPGLFEFSKSKLRFSRTISCSKKCCCSLYDQLSLQDKNLVIILYVFFKNSQDFSRILSCIPFVQDFSGMKNYFFIFQVFKLFEVQKLRINKSVVPN